MPGGGSDRMNWGLRCQGRSRRESLSNKHHIHPTLPSLLGLLPPSAYTTPPSAPTPPVHNILQTEKKIVGLCLDFRKAKRAEFESLDLHKMTLMNGEGGLAR